MSKLDGKTVYECDICGRTKAVLNPLFDKPFGWICIDGLAICDRCRDGIKWAARKHEKEVNRAWPV